MRNDTMLASALAATLFGAAMLGGALAQDQDQEREQQPEAEAATPAQDARARRADDFPSEPPATAEPRGFDLPEVTTYSLRNGLTVTMVPYGNVPKAIVRAVVMTGNVDDGDQPYISDLTADMLEQGAGGLDAAGLAERAASMGGELGVGVGENRTFVTLDVLSEDVPDAVDLIASVLREPALPEGELERLKADMVRDLSVAASQPGVQASEAFGALVYPGHPYAGQLPEPEQVAAYTADDVRAFHAGQYGAQRTHLYVVGQFGERKVRRAVRRAFRKWDAGPEATEIDVPEAQAPQVVLIDRPDSVQSTVQMGLRVPPVDGEVALDAADTLLGGYFSSRITRNIREDKGYTYSPASYVDAPKGAASWREAADIQIQSTGPAIAEVLSEVERLREEAPSEAETDGIRNYMSGVFVVQLASRGGLAAQLAEANLHGLGPEYLEGYVGKVRALTPEAIRAAAEEHLDPARMQLVVVGDTSRTGPQLRELPAFADRLGEDVPSAPAEDAAAEDEAASLPAEEADSPAEGEGPTEE